MNGCCTRIPHVVTQMLACAAEAEAVKLGTPMAIAVVDAEGGTQYFLRMDGALPASSNLAVSKAYTAAILRMSSAEVGELAQPGAPLYGIGSTHNGRIVLFGGGLPLRLHGEVVGAVGVSGGSVKEDVRVATPAVELLQQMERWAMKFREALPATNVGLLAVEHVKDELWNALEQAGPRVPFNNRAALVGAVCLALS